jgi:two-component system NtrC family sensor kinase
VVSRGASERGICATEIKLLGNLAHNTQAYLLYLLYGAAFLYLGVSIVAKDKKGSDLKIGGCLWLLAGFAFLHGICEWLELGHLVDAENASTGQVSGIKGAMLGVNVVSYLFLLMFGSCIVSKITSLPTWIAKAVPVSLILFWVSYLVYCGADYDSFTPDAHFLREAKKAGRALFGLPGSMLAALGLIVHSREMKVLDESAARKLSFAGLSFFFYGIFTVLPSPGLSFPVTVPAELLRGISAGFITYFLAGGLNLFDIEKRKRYERQTRRLVQAEKLASLGQLAAGIAHEINNPLACASLGVERLKTKLRSNGKIGDAALEMLDVAERNIDRASAIAKELLQFSRSRETRFVPVDINRLIEGALLLMQYKLREHKASTQLAPLPLVLGDAGKLEQVFINALSNSIEAMPDSGEISISTCTEGQSVVIRISDNGTGIRPEDLGSVFDPFFTTKEIGNGTGLGLYISYGIIAQHKGEIEIESRPGQGTVLTVRLPAGNP